MDQAQAKKVVIESPFAGEEKTNVRYLQAAMRDSLLRGEAPYASHGLYTQPGVLDDKDPVERELGIRAGFAWRPEAELTVFYIDRGFSSGMNKALKDCLDRTQPFEFRSLRTGLSYQGREHTQSSSAPEGAEAA